MRSSNYWTFGFSALALLGGVHAEDDLETRAAAAIPLTAPAAQGGTGPALITPGQANSAGTGNPKNGQTASLTDKDNFINFCQSKTSTNGLQNTGGSCNPVVMGDIPAKTKMISTVITNPKNGQNVAPNTPFDVTLQITNLQAGVFTNPDVTYFAAPQQVNTAGNIIGHVHVTVQDMGKDINSPTPPDPTVFAFFKGIDDAGNGQGALKASVAKGLPAGNYRACTMSAASNHQPVIMPVAQRGAQDDCVRFTVGGAGAATAGTGAAAAAAAPPAAGTGTAAAAVGKGAAAAAAGGATKAAAAGGAKAAAEGAKPAAGAPAAGAKPAAGGEKKQGKGKGKKKEGGRGRGRGGRGRRSEQETARFAVREFIV